MRRIATGIAVVLFAGLAGCVTIASPVRPRSPVAPAGEAAPSIAVVEYEPTGADPQATKSFSQGLQSALTRAPFMSNASLNPTGDVHYLFALQPSVSHSSAWALAVLTGALLPGTATDVLGVTLTVYEPATGREMFTVKAERDRNTIFWLPFIFATPFNLIFRDQDPEEEVYSGAFAQAAAGLAGRGLPPAVPAAELPRHGRIAPVPLPVQ